MNANPEPLHNPARPKADAPTTVGVAGVDPLALSGRGVYGPSAPWRRLVERRRWVGVVGACFAVAILLLSSSVPVNPSSPHSRPRIAGSSNPSTPPSPFLPYVVNTSQFPLPDTLLNGTGNISSPQLIETSLGNETYYEVVYTSTNLTGVETLQYLYGRFDPHDAGCLLNLSSCTGFLGMGQLRNLPIAWGAPYQLLGWGPYRNQATSTAIAGTGSTVAIAASTGNQTRVFLAGDYGLGGTGSWLNLTPQAIPGSSPRVVMTPSTVFVTTNSSSGVVATTYHLPTGYPISPPGAGGRRGPLVSTPTVTSVSPFFGPDGTVVTIIGANFQSNAIVYFGTVPAPTTYVSSTKLTARVAGPTSQLPVNVTVNQGGLVSPNNPPYDWFTVSPNQPVPEILSVATASGLPGTTTNLTGYGFETPATAFFGSYGPASVSLTNDTTATSTVPVGTGSQEIVIICNALPSHPTVGSTFTIQAAQVTLAKAVSATPVLLAGSKGPSNPVEGILMTSLSGSQVTFYNSTNGGVSFASHATGGRYSLSTGSPIFDRIGSTHLFASGGTAGATASVGFGSTIFGLFTTNLMNRTLVETEGSSDGGRTWTGPYVSAPLVGTVASPYATISPAGYVYVTWLENGAGPWQVDQAVYSESGRELSAPEVISTSGGPLGDSAFAPTVAIDGLARPLYLWGSYNTSVGGYVLRATGAYLSAANTLADLWRAFNSTVPTDYNATDFVGSNAANHLASFQGNVTAALGQLESTVQRRQVCPSQVDAVGTLLPLVTRVVPVPLSYGYAGHCAVSVSSAWKTQVSNTSGPMSANTFLSIYANWLSESVGYAIFKEPSWPGAPSKSTLLRNFTIPNHPATPPDSLGVSEGSNYYLRVSPLTVNPNTVLFNVTGWFNSSYEGGFSGGGGRYCHKLTGSSTSIVPAYANETITIYNPYSNGTATVYHPSGWMPSTFATDIAPGVSGWWSVNVRVENLTSRDIETCGGSTFTHSWAAGPNVTVAGYYTTNLEPLPTNPVVHVSGSPAANGSQANYLAWNNSMEAQSGAAVAGGAGYHSPSSLSNRSFQISENTHPFWVPVNQSYTAWVNLTSANGTTNSSWANRFDTGLNNGQVTSALTSGYSCAFNEVYNPISVYWNATENNFTSNVTTSSVTLTWYSNQAGSGWVRYNESDDGPYTQAATFLNLTISPNHPYHDSKGRVWNYGYIAQLHGLSPWGLYLVYMGVSTYTGCLEYDQAGAAYVQVESLVTPTETDLPYDSITQQGGGAQVTWSVPSAFSSTAKFQNGSLTYCNWSAVSKACVTNSTVVVPLPTLSAMVGSPVFTYHWVNSTFQVNLTALVVNTTYSYWVLLNYTLSGVPFVAGSDASTFVYEKDTSGDGLTDWEKLRGWPVTEQIAPGSFRTYTATADPTAFATNGLTSDYLEKEYGLDPRFISTTGDGLLDLYNLTFDLGRVSGSQPALPSSGFDYWYENASYQFNKSCPDPSAGSSCSFTPPLIDANNLTATGPANPGGDNSPWAAEVLWNGVGNSSALAQLEVMVASGRVGSFGALRAVTGHIKLGGVNHRTITVWGKLSWGADPLAYSTSELVAQNGSTVPDGAMVEPLGVTAVNVTLDSWSMSGLQSGGGDGVAVFIHASSAATPFFPNGQTDYSAYSVNSSAPGAGDSYGTQFPVSFPVVPTEQFATLNFSLVAKKSGGNFIQDRTGSISVDLVDGASGFALLSGHNPAQNYTLNLTYRPVPVYSKANTLIVVPGDNSTLNRLPLGLQRYVGEQNFVLLAINDTVPGSSYTLTSGSTPWVNSTGANGISTGSYTVHLFPGMNNLLVPRALFKNSPLGEALLNVTFQNISQQGFQGGLEGSFAPGYWIARVTGTVYNGVNYSCSRSTCSSGNIRVYSNTTQNCTSGSIQCGGVPSNPNIEANVPAYAVGAIFTLNMSTGSDLSELMAGLLLNQSGNFTGWMYGATSNLASLDLSSTVMGALANPVLFSSGGYGTPIYNPPTGSPTGWSALGAAVWNSVSGVVAALGSALWTAFTAAASYAANIVEELASWGLRALMQTMDVLKAVTSAIAWITEQIALFVQRAIEGLLRPAIQAIQSTFGALLLAMFHGYAIANSSNRGPSTTANLPFSSGAAPLYETMAVLGILITLGVTLAMPVEPILGPVWTVIPLVLTALLGVTGTFLPYLHTPLTLGSSLAAFNATASLASIFLDPGCVGDNAAIQSALTAWMFGVVSVFVALIVFAASLAREASVVFPSLALTFSIMAMLFFVYIANPVGSPTTQQIQFAVDAGVIFAFMSIGFDALAFLNPEFSFSTNALIAAAAGGIDGTGLALGRQAGNQACS